MKVTSARRRFKWQRTTMIPRSVNASRKIATAPDVNISFKTSTSFVRRVMSRPTGFLSKYATSFF